MNKTDNLTPAKIVAHLDHHIIGQPDAKRAVALAFRNRWRRMQITDEDMRREITPKNILLVGPTGVGKTEIARRLARLADAPFIKVEATKFTEVGYVGRDVDSIIRDLMTIAHGMAREQLVEQHMPAAEKHARARVVDALAPVDDGERTKLELHVEAGKLDKKEIDVNVTQANPHVGVRIQGMEDNPQIQDMMESVRNIFPQQGTQKTRKRLPINQALRVLRQEELNDKVSEEEVTELALEMVEQNGIVFIDEIDKVATRTEHSIDISRAGVQRDLLPLVEGTTVQTKFGPVLTDHILFIAAGSFHYAKPSDLIPELQGRLPVRVHLESLGVVELERILSETDYCLTRQYQQLLATENLQLEFTPDARMSIAEIAHGVNERQENIGARRLHTIMEKLVEKISFDADKQAGEIRKFDANSVKEALSAIIEDEEASRIFL